MVLFDVTTEQAIPVLTEVVLNCIPLVVNLQRKKFWSLNFNLNLPDMLQRPFYATRHRISQE